MLNNISKSDNYNIKDNSDVSKVNLNGYKTDKKNETNGLLVDETNISSDAMALYEREEDINRFTALAMTDFESVEEDTKLVMDKIFNISSTMRDEELAESLLQNDRFRTNLLG